MPPAARVGDQTGHPGVITGPGVMTVLIGGKPAAVVGDTHTCSAMHPPGPFAMGCQSVLIGGRQALRVGDVAACGAPISNGAPDVLIGG
jgi:uncharacterized Zn-binding protein involved in type VI secretion